MKGLIVLVLLLPNLSYDWFEGKITYQMSLIDKNGTPGIFPILIEDVYYSTNKKITKVIEGDFIDQVGNYFLLIDTEKKTRYEVWPQEKRIVDIGKEPAQDVYYKIDKTDQTERILGFECTLFKIKRKTMFEADTTFISLYVSQLLKTQSASQFVDIGGNLSTDGIDGSISGIPLKIVIQSKTGIVRQEAIEITQGKLFGTTEKYFEDLEIISAPR